jgi:hypothetical protein
MRDEHDYRTARPDKFPDCRFIGKVALDVFDFTKLRIVDTLWIQQEPIPRKGAAWQAFLLKAPGQVETNEARSADDPYHSLIDSTEAPCSSTQDTWSEKERISDSLAAGFPSLDAVYLSLWGDLLIDAGRQPLL